MYPRWVAFEQALDYFLAVDGMDIRCVNAWQSFNLFFACKIDYPREIFVIDVSLHIFGVYRSGEVDRTFS
jgi:hypothetical protein